MLLLVDGRGGVGWWRRVVVELVRPGRLLLVCGARLLHRLLLLALGLIVAATVAVHVIVGRRITAAARVTTVRRGSTATHAEGSGEWSGVE